jgi:HEAT repeat protein
MTFDSGARQKNPAEKIDLLIEELEKTSPNTSVCRELRELLSNYKPDDETRRRATEALKKCGD